MSPKIICKVFLLFFLSGLPTLFTVNVSAQNSSGKKVSGKVTDENGNAMPGVSITVSGSSAGTSTDSSGNFSITAPSKSSTLIFSSVNYLNKEGKKLSISLR